MCAYHTCRKIQKTKFSLASRVLLLMANATFLFSASGIVEPVRGGVEAGLRLGVGKAEQESFYMAADNVVRKKLEVELQADENQERRDKREVHSPSES